MSLILSISDVRDWVIVIWGIIGIIFVSVSLIISVVLFFTVKGLIGKVSRLLDDSVTPALNSVRQAADNVRGTTDFVGRTAVAPVIKVYGTFAGIRKGLGVLTGLTGRGRSR